MEHSTDPVLLVLSMDQMVRAVVLPVSSYTLDRVSDQCLLVQSELGTSDNSDLTVYLLWTDN